MKILVTLGLSNKTMKYHIYPLTQLKEVDKILIIRDSPPQSAQKMDKVLYFTPPKFLLKIPPIKALYRFLLLLKVGIVEKPDISMAYYLFTYGVSAFLIGKILGIPISLSVISNKELEIHPKSIRYFLKKILEHANAITVTGTKTKKDLIKWCDISPNGIYILPHAVDIERFSPKSNPKEYDVITVARLYEVKNLDILLKSIKLVKQRIPDIKVAIIGGGPKKNSLQSLSNKLELQENVDFLGYKSDVEKYYPLGKIYVLTSKWEGIPFALIEAMSCGLPCIVSNVGDISDIIQNNKNGILINNPMDVEGYASAIVKLLGDKNLYKKLSKNALKEIKERHMSKNVSKTWKKIFMDLKINKVKQDCGKNHGGL